MKKKILNSVFIAIIIYSSLILLKVYLTGRTLWLDEGMLAWSFTQRSLTNLISKPLEWMQSAPALYLYIVKIITPLGYAGTAEYFQQLGVSIPKDEMIKQMNDTKQYQSIYQ